MSQGNVGDLRGGWKIKCEGEPYTVVSNEFVKPGKGQPFNRLKLKHLITGRVIERTFKSGEKVELADVEQVDMRLLYLDREEAVFMNDATYDQLSIPLKKLEEVRGWLLDELIYSVLFLEGLPISVEPPLFLDFQIEQTEPGLRGDTSGRVMKWATLSNGIRVQVPIFLEQGEWIRVDTRTTAYVSRIDAPK